MTRSPTHRRAGVGRDLLPPLLFVALVALFGTACEPEDPSPAAPAALPAPVSTPAPAIRATSCGEMRKMVVEAVIDVILAQYDRWRSYGVGLEVPYLSWAPSDSFYATHAERPGGNPSFAPPGEASYVTSHQTHPELTVADFVVTDGRYVFSTASGDQMLRIIDLEGEAAPELVGQLAIEGGDFHADMQLLGSHLGILTSINLSREGEPAGVGSDLEAFASTYGVRLTLVDVTNKRDPRRVRQIAIEGDGAPIAWRRGHLLYLYATRRFPESLWTDAFAAVAALDDELDDVPDETPEARRGRLVGPLTTRVQDLVEALGDEAFLPQVHDLDVESGAIRRGHLLECIDVLRPDHAGAAGLMALAQLNLRDLQSPIQGTGLLTYGGAFYFGPDHVWAAATNGCTREVGGCDGPEPEPATVLHRFAPNGGGLELEGSARIAGRALSLHESEGRLQVLSERGRVFAPDQRSGNEALILDANDADLAALDGVAEVGSPTDGWANVTLMTDRLIYAALRPVNTQGNPKPDVLQILGPGPSGEAAVLGEVELTSVVKRLWALDETHALVVGSGLTFGMPLEISLVDATVSAAPVVTHSIALPWGLVGHERTGTLLFDGDLVLPVHSATVGSDATGFLVVSIDVDEGIVPVGLAPLGGFAEAFCSELMLLCDVTPTAPWRNQIRRPLLFTNLDGSNVTSLVFVTMAGLQLHPLKQPEVVEGRVILMTPDDPRLQP